MEIIWFNPDMDIYEKGSIDSFKNQVGSSAIADRYSILYQFNSNSNKLANKILDSLNLVRENRLSDNQV